MIEQHPIPQQISSYEFRLVGDMTLKQFFKLAGGALLGFAFYQSGFPFYLRWPLALGFLGLGVASAFLPIHERPLEVWIMNFFKRVYSPTIFLWKREGGGTVFSPLRAPLPPPPAKKIKAEDKTPRLREFLRSLPSSPAAVAPSPPSSPAVPVKPTEKKKEGISPEELVEIEKAFRKKPQGKFFSPQFEKTPMPATPTTPNIVNGLVLDDQGKVLEGAIVEIQDIEGNPIRAMRTNRLGQFQTATPLPPGNYLIIVEKEPYQFDIIKIEAQGKVIAPIRIEAKKGVVS